MTWNDLSAQVAEEFDSFETNIDEELKSFRLTLSDVRATSQRTPAELEERIVRVAATRVRWSSTELAAAVGDTNAVQCGVVLSKCDEWRKTESSVWVSAEQRYVCRYYWINDSAILSFFEPFESVTLTHEYVARMLGVEPATVSRLLRRHGWKRSRRTLKRSDGRRKYVWFKPTSTQPETVAA